MATDGTLEIGPRGVQPWREHDVTRECVGGAAAQLADDIVFEPCSQLAAVADREDENLAVVARAAPRAYRCAARDGDNPR